MRRLIPQLYSLCVVSMKLEPGEVSLGWTQDVFILYFLFNCVLFGFPTASPCFKSSSSKSDRHLQFVSTNLHSQRMEVTSRDSTGTSRSFFLFFTLFPLHLLVISFVHFFYLHICSSFASFNLIVSPSLFRCVVWGYNVWCSSWSPPGLQTRWTKEAAQQIRKQQRQVCVDVVVLAFKTQPISLVCPLLFFSILQSLLFCSYCLPLHPSFYILVVG